MCKELRSNCVELGGFEIWKNRPFEDWHLPFPVTIGPLKGCFDANCPYPYHASPESFTDPYTRAFIDSLSIIGPKLVNHILIQTDSNGLEETHYATFNHVITDKVGVEELIFQECRIPWKNIRYAALIDNPHVRPFCKQGGQLLFRNELTQIVGASMEEVHQAVSKLDGLNRLDSLPVRMRFPEGTWICKLSHYFDVGIVDAFQYDLDSIMCISPIDVAFTFGVIAQQNKLARLRSLIPNWKPEKPDELADGLNRFCRWYLKCVPNSEDTIAGWKQQWINMFKLKF